MKFDLKKGETHSNKIDWTSFFVFQKKFLFLSKVKVKLRGSESLRGYKNGPDYTHVSLSLSPTINTSTRSPRPSSSYHMCTVRTRVCLTMGGRRADIYGDDGDNLAYSGDVGEIVKRSCGCSLDLFRSRDITTRTDRKKNSFSTVDDWVMTTAREGWVCCYSSAKLTVYTRWLINNIFFSSSAITN